jgi:Glyoxalase/Bleomycin resistance protein/Dioxygenase superfamily
MEMIELDFFGKDAQLDHVGLVVKSIFAICPDRKSIEDPIQKVSVLFTKLNGLEIELIEPLSEESSVSDSLRRGMKLLHICYSVPDLEKALALCKEHGFRLLARPVPATAFDMRRIAWVFNKYFGLFELLETKK